MFVCLQAKFITEAQALLHGDMHTGSLMVTQDTTYAIDAEFAVYGPIAFDVGKFLANLLLAFFALDGHCSEREKRSQQRQWLLQVRVIVEDNLAWLKIKPLPAASCARVGMVKPLVLQKSAPLCTREIYAALGLAHALIVTKAKAKQA